MRSSFADTLTYYKMDCEIVKNCNFTEVKVHPNHDHTCHKDADTLIEQSSTSCYSGTNYTHY